MAEAKTYIGIDVGVHTGYAVWNGSERRFEEIRTVGICEAMDAVIRRFNAGQDIRVVFEDARQRRWFGTKGRESLQGAGSIKRESAIWEDFLAFHNIPFEMRGPKAGMTKWDARYFAKVTGWQGRTSEHARDAALLVYQR